MIESWTIKWKLKRFLKNNQMFYVEIFHKLINWVRKEVGGGGAGIGAVGIKILGVEIFLKN